MMRAGFSLALALPILLAAAPSWSAEPSQNDGPVVTANAEPKPTAAQAQAQTAPVAPVDIDSYLNSIAQEQPDGPRKPHGEISVGVGTNGYRSVYARSDIPVGQTGEVSIAIGETRFNGRGGGRLGPTGAALDGCAPLNAGRLQSPALACQAPPLR